MAETVEKLEPFGDLLDYPHTSRVRGARDQRELRPRAGRSPWRAFYRRIDQDIVVGASGLRCGPTREASREPWR